MKTTINLGLATAAGPVSVAQGLHCLRQCGATILAYDVQESATEQTIVARLARPMSRAEAFDLCMALNQDCVAQMHGEHGALIGPRAEQWGEFNPQYFLELGEEFAEGLGGHHG